MSLEPMPPHTDGAPPPPSGRWRSELVVYYVIVGLYFYAFGLQFVLFPAIATFELNADGSQLGFAQLALQGPMFLFLLWGGLAAERARASTALLLLHLGLAVPSVVLAWLLATHRLTFDLLVSYALVVGTFAAFMMPVRDAALNGCFDRSAPHTRIINLAQAATIVAAVQLGAQIAGILTARMASVDPTPFLLLQAGVLTAAGLMALLLRAPKPQKRPRSITLAFREIGDGLSYAFRNPVMGPMLWSAGYVGVFIIGALQPLFSILVRDVYRGGTDDLGTLFALFGGASFISAALLSRSPPLQRPGRALIGSHLLSAAALYSIAMPLPFWAFGVVAFCWGLAAGVAISMSRSIVQNAASTAYLGRVLAVYTMGFMGAAPIGAYGVGILAELAGPRLAALAPATGLVLACVALAVWSPIWRMTAADAHHARDVT